MSLRDAIGINIAGRYAGYGFLIIMFLVMPGCMSGGYWPVFPLQQAPGDYPAMRYYAWLQSASPEELEAERARLILNGGASMVENVQLALVLTHLPINSLEASLENEGRAREILDRIGAGGGTGAGQPAGDYELLGRLWHDVLIQRESLREARSDLRSNEHRVDSLEANIEVLTKQIEALTTLEQQMIERERSRQESQ